MSLIEVVIAVSLIAILVTASLGVYLSSANASATLQRREAAVTIASQTLETVSVVAPTDLYIGRTATAVESLRAANVVVPGVDQTYKVAGAAGTVTVPLISEQTFSGTKYTVNTIIGTCFQDKKGGTCTGAANSNQPSTVPAGKTVLSRVIVVVRWDAGANCKPVACSYHSTTLIDAHSEIEWRTT
jgi:type II secretory pathway pseudopilin PulG